MTGIETGEAEPLKKRPLEEREQMIDTFIASRRGRND